MSKIFLTFFNRISRQEQELSWDLLNTPLARRWFAELWRALGTEGNVREERYFGWANRPKDQEFRVQKLNRAIDILNHYFKGKYEIAERAHFGMDQTLLNKLHHHFEILMGQSWNRNAWINEGVTPEVHFAVRTLNDMVHEYEFSEQANRALKIGERQIGGFQWQLAPYKQIPLSIEDLESFNFANEPGDLVTNYCQLGKTWVEVYNDHDNRIDDSNIAPLRYFSSGFLCNFHRFSHEQSIALSNKMKEFIKKRANGKQETIDINDPRLALGHATYAKLSAGSPVLLLSESDRTEFFCQFAETSSIRLCEGEKTIFRNFRQSLDYYGML